MSRDSSQEETRPLSLTTALRQTRSLLQLADRAYAPFSCPASGECCQLARTGRPPWLWKTEWLLLEAAGPLPPSRSDGACPFLDATGLRCGVYAHRPFGCRTFFCARAQGPSRHPLEETNRLLERLEELNQRFEPQPGPRPILDWHKSALDCAPSPGHGKLPPP